MEDRNVQFPNRFKLVKVEGTDDIFDLVPAPGTIGSEGTYLNKANLLKDATAALFGLTADAVPDDVFNAIIGMFADVDQTFVVSVPVSWSDDGNGGYLQTVAVDGIKESDNPGADIILGTDITANRAYLDAWKLVTRIVTSNGAITIYANEGAPQTSFTMQLKVVR